MYCKPPRRGIRLPLLVAAAAALIWSGCGKPERNNIQRLAILPVENLSSDAKINSAAAAITALIHARTSGLPALHSYRVLSASDLQSGFPTLVLRGYVAEAGGRLRFQGSLQDGLTGRTVRALEAQAMNGGAAIQDISAAIAREITPQPRAAGSNNAEALRLFGDGLVAPLKEAPPLLEAAVKADPSFGEAWVSLAQSVASDPQALTAAARQGLAQRLDELDRAKLAFLSSGPDGSAAGRAEAIARLARLQPADADVNMQAAGLLQLKRQFQQSLEFYERALRALPERGVYWNDAAYGQAFAGRIDLALASVARYGELEPNNANPLDSRGDIQFIAGRFTDAEKSYLESYTKQPGLFGGLALRKAAEAARMRGDVAAADAHFKKYLDAHARNPLTGVPQAQWLRSTGRIKEAEQTLKAVAENTSLPPEAVAQALGQMSVWRLVDGDRVQARALAAKAARTAKTDAARVLAFTAAFVSAEDAPAAEWHARAARAFPNPRHASIKMHALAYALLLGKRFGEAAQVLREIYDQTPPNSDGVIRTLLAWSLAETGKGSEAAALAARYPHPLPSAEGVFDCLAFPRYLSLRPETRDLFKRYGGR